MAKVEEEVGNALLPADILAKAEKCKAEANDFVKSMSNKI